MKLRTMILASLAGVAILVTGVGCARYGGPSGVVRRVQAEIGSHRPHPVFVPTPLAPLAVATSPAVESLAPAPEGAVVAPLTKPEPETAATATSTPLPAPTATPAHAPPTSAVTLTNFHHQWQTWNNCGPATLAMGLSYFGSALGQADVATVLRPDPDDKNVSPHEMVAYARSQGYRARLQVNGNLEQLRLLLSNGIPVIVETWHVPEPNDGMGHYRLLAGYDDANQRWIAYDSYDAEWLVNPDGEYQGIYLPYAGLDDLWKVFNRVAVVVYTDELTPLVESILGPSLDDAIMWQQSLLRAQVETEQNPDDPFAWFNLGSSYVALGQYAQAAAAYDRARQIGLPWRMLWYQFGPFQAYYEAGRYAEVVALADATLQVVHNLEEVHYWRGRALLAQGDLAGARRAFQRAVALNVNYKAAADALAALPS